MCMFLSYRDLLTDTEDATPDIMANVPPSPFVIDVVTKLDLTVDTSCDSAASTVSCTPGE